MRQRRTWTLGASAILSVVSLGLTPFGCAGEETASGAGGVPCTPELEVCDGKDNDCNNQVDEGCDCLPGDTQPCYSGPPATQGIGTCVGGQQTCDADGHWGACADEIVPAATDACDGLDDTCDGMTDEACDCSPPVPETTQDCYTGAAGTKDIGACHAGKQSCTPEGKWSTECTAEVKPANETCDLLDNDCNGAADDMGEATCGVGACQVTITKCVEGQLNTCMANQPSLEVCDGVDNDCDQLVDENFPEKGKACSTEKPGVCTAGKSQCVAGALACVSDIDASPEKCDSLDNNCDGSVDNNVPGTGGACSSGYPGVCNAGAIQCKDDVVDCFPIVDASPETCDGLDNDCNGTTDEGNPGGGDTCNTGLGGLCAAGKKNCTDGLLKCTPNLASASETCDGLDNNCNGIVDENDPGGNVACSTGLSGACAAGTKHCTNGVLLCQQNTQVSAEICDGIDNNCNGMTDDGNPGGGDSCDTQLLGVCAPGTMTCLNGQVSCKQNVPSTPENCTNGLDDNCDGVGDAPSTVYFEENFANNSKGWTLGTTWGIGPATTSSGHNSGNPDPATDHTLSTTDNGLAGVVIGGNAPLVAHNAYYLTSPPIDLSAATGSLYLEYWRWLNSDYAPYMVNTVDVWNGTTWINLYMTSTFPGIVEAAWTKVQNDITAHKNAAFQVRYGFSIGQVSGLYIVSSWNVDDVKISNISCP